jgi:hypothetical protein
MANYGIYRGIVVNTADPMMKGRLQINIPSQPFGGPAWAEACRDYKSTATPPIGTQVWVMFEAGDPAHPVWMGCAS